MSEKRRLKRGLESLLGSAAEISGGEYTFAPDLGVVPKPLGERNLFFEHRIDPGEHETPADEILGELMREKPAYEIPISLIDRNRHQPRLDFDEAELADLAESLKKHGMIQPVVVRQTDRRFELVAGERRLRAAQLAGWERIPAHLLIVDDREMAEIALTENLQRRDLNAIEKAVAFRNYLEVYGGTNEELAKRLDLDRSTISNLIRLLELPEEVQQMVRRGELAMGHVRALLGIKKETQIEAAEKIRSEGWSVRQVEEYTNQLKQNSEQVAPRVRGNGKIGPRISTVQQSEHFIEMENQFRQLFGTKVKLSANAKGKGKLVIPFSSNDEFERIYQLILMRMR